MAIAPTPLVELHAFWTLYMVNSLQFTRSARFILAHRKNTEKQPEEHGMRQGGFRAFCSFFRASSVLIRG